MAAKEPFVASPHLGELLRENKFRTTATTERYGALLTADCGTALGSKRQPRKPADQGGPDHGKDAANVPRPHDRGNQLCVRGRPVPGIDSQPQLQRDRSSATEPPKSAAVNAREGNQ